MKYYKLKYFCMIIHLVKNCNPLTIVNHLNYLCHQNNHTHDF